MDIFDIHNVKMEKTNAMIHYNQFRKITKLFRLVELFLAVFLSTWISIRLPFVIGILSDYFRQLLSVVVSPIFIFLIGNVIIVTLVVKSGQITDNPSEFYEEIAHNVREIEISFRSVVPVVKPEPEPEPEEIVYQDKRIVTEVNTKHKNKVNEHLVPDLVTDPDLKDLKVYRRSQSENLMKNECFLNPDEAKGKLKRSETEIGRDKVMEKDENDVVVDELSNEEFQKKIEGFIARQIRFRQEEKLAIVEHS